MVIMIMIIMLSETYRVLDDPASREECTSSDLTAGAHLVFVIQVSTTNALLLLICYCYC